MSDPVLQVRNLKVYYHTERGPVKAVEDVSFDLEQGMRLGLVGESGCGKSTLAMGILRLIKSPGRIEGGQVLLDGQDLVKLSDEQMRHLRLVKISLIPQGAMNSLNPVMRIRDQIIDGILDHAGEAGIPTTPTALNDRVNEVLAAVDLERRVANMYPHELSGGMKQRACVAIAISLRPRVIIADEPTSALDVVIQRQVMETIRRLQESMGISVILIGHDMGLMAQTVDRLVVMYAGRAVEIAWVKDIFENPLHPYTQLLISSLPTLKEKGVFRGIPGITPSLLNAPSNECLFRPRCPKAKDCPSDELPGLEQVSWGHWVACHLYQEVKMPATGLGR